MGRPERLTLWLDHGCKSRLSSRYSGLQLHFLTYKTQGSSLLNRSPIHVEQVESTLFSGRKSISCVTIVQPPAGWDESWTSHRKPYFDKILGDYPVV